VQQAILDEITAGRFAPGDRLIQEQVAQGLGVSRQPVQQALLLLRNQGVLQDAPGRGLIVAPLDADYIGQMYAMRAVLEGLAARRAAENAADRAARLGPPLIEAGRRAVDSGSHTRMVAADTRFHELLYALSGNTLVAPALATHLTYTQRVMGGVLNADDKPTDIWDQHEAILDAICAGEGERAERLARRHITEASEFLVARLGGQRQAPTGVDEVSAAAAAALAPAPAA
jgi:DNA-binding GntR family transcriptional regulator